MRRRLGASLALVGDVGASLLSWTLAYAFRFNLHIPSAEIRALCIAMLVAAPVYAVSFVVFGLYSAIWRYASLRDLRRIIFAIGVGAVVVPAVFLMLRVAESVPRSVFIMQPLVLLLIIGGSRLALRGWREHSMSLLTSPRSTPILILGAGDAAASLIRELQRQSAWRVVGLLDDDRRKQGRELFGYRIFGPLADVATVAEQLDVKNAVIAMPGASHRDRLRAVDLCKAAGLEVRTVPSYADLVSGRVSVSQIREVELDDLLGRDPVQLDNNGLHKLIAGKTVLVTGAGGSIGAELCRQIARFAPSRLLLFELSELALYTIQQEFRDYHPDLPVVALIGDVKSAARVREVMKGCRPSIIFHAAAYKHVPLMEEDNAFEAVKNNVQGTLVLALEAKRSGIEHFVLVSTDKAVNPTNVMGASKRLAELICQALAREPGPQFVIVRFGNVLGSTGSVIPRFREQIARGGPVTVTHPDIQRYFMSIPEAAQLVLQAALMGRSGEIYVLDMGEPVRILDLARELIKLSGFSEDEIKIEFTGLRPGEKLYEELLADAEQTGSTHHPKLRIAVSVSPPEAGLLEGVSALLACDARQDSEVRNLLGRWIPEYRPAATGSA